MASKAMPEVAFQNRPLTITFIGRSNSGKSSLANCLLGIKHFENLETRALDHEADFKTLLPDFRIRALEGYGSAKVPSRRFPDQQNDDLKIDPDEVVIMVLPDQMDRKDKQVLRNLIAGGHWLERIIFVRSKFDGLRDPELERLKLSESSKEGFDVVKKLKGRQRKEHRIILESMLTDQNSHLIHPHLPNGLPEEWNEESLLLLSAKSVSTFRDKDDKALVDAIRAALDDKERQVFDFFKQLRPKSNQGMKERIKKRVWRVIAKNQGKVFSPLIRQLEKEGYDEDLSEQAISELLDKFNQLFLCDKAFRCDFDKIIQSGDEVRQKILVQQFTSFYLSEILGERWYEFIKEHKECIDKRFVEVDKFGQTPLHQRSRTGLYGWLEFWLQLTRLSWQPGKQQETAEQLLEKRDINGRTPLHLAVYSGSQDSVEVILEHDTGNRIINARDKVGYTPLHWAAYYGRVEIAKRLLNYGAKLPENRREKITALHLAAWAGQTGMIKMLVAEGVGVNIATVDGNTPLDYASLSGNRDSLDTLLDYEDIQPNHVSNRGLTALDLATHHTNNNEYAIRQLRSKKAKTSHRFMILAPELSEHSYNYLYWDTEAGSGRMYEPAEYFWLLTPFPPMADESTGESLHGYSPMYRAIREGDESFTPEQEPLNTPHGKDQWTALHLASACGHARVVEELVKKAGAGIYKRYLHYLLVNMKAANHLTPLHLAAYGGHTDVVEKLLAVGADPSARTVEGKTALHLAATSGKIELIDLLIDDETCRIKPGINEKTNTGQTTLHIAAIFGHARLVRYLCVLGSDPDTADINQFTPLHLASLYGQADVVKSLRFTGFKHNPLTIMEADPDLLTIHGDAAIHLAAMNNHVSVLEALADWAKPDIKANAELYPELHFVGSSACNRVGATALHFAASRGRDEAVRTLVTDCKADVLERCTRKGWVALHFAAYSGHCNTIRLLVNEFKIPVDIRNAMEAGWRTPLHLSYENDQTDAVDTLKQLDADSSKITFWQGADDRFFPSPVWIAIKNGSLKSLKKLAEEKTNLSQSSFGISPLSYAAKLGQPEILEYLLQQKAKPGRTHPLSESVSCCNPGCLRHLIDYGYSVKAFDDKHTSCPLIIRAITLEVTWRNEQLHEVVRILLDNGASLEQRKDNKWTPLHLVVMRDKQKEEDVELTRLLLGLGSDTEARDRSGRTALHWAAQTDNETLMELLLEKGANREARNNKGNTPLLHIIDVNGKIATLRWLLEHDTDPNAQNHQSQTPLMLAARKKQTDMVVALLNKGASLAVRDRNGNNGLHYIFQHLSATAAEIILYLFRHLITHDFLNTTNSQGKYPVESIRDNNFKWYVKGLTFPCVREIALKDARQRQDDTRLQMLEGAGRSRQ